MPSPLIPTLQLGDSLFWQRDLERVEWLRDGQDLALFTLCGERVEVKGSNLTMLLADLTSGCSVLLNQGLSVASPLPLLDFQVTTVRKAPSRPWRGEVLAPLLLNLPTRFIVLEAGTSTSLFGADRLLCVSHDESNLWLGFTTACFCLRPRVPMTSLELDAALKGAAQGDWNVFTIASANSLLPLGAQRRFWAEQIKEYGPKVIYSQGSLRQHLTVLREPPNVQGNPLAPTPDMSL